MAEEKPIAGSSTVIADMPTGYLMLKETSYKSSKKDKTASKLFFVIVNQGTIFYYKEESDQHPKGEIQLSGVTIMKAATEGDLVVHTPQSLWTVHANTDSKALEWIEILEKAAKQGPGVEPKREAKATKKRSSFSYKVSKGVGSKLLSASVAQNGIKDALDKDTKETVRLIKLLINEISGEDKAVHIEESIVKIFYKIYVEIQEKNIDEAAFAQLLPPLRSAFALLEEVFSAYGYTPDDLQQKLKEIESHFKSVSSLLCQIIKSRLHSKNIALIHELFEFVCGSDFLNAVWKGKENPAIDAAIQDLLMTMENKYKLTDKPKVTPMDL